MTIHLLSKHTPIDTSFWDPDATIWSPAKTLSTSFETWDIDVWAPLPWLWRTALCPRPPPSSWRLPTLQTTTPRTQKMETTRNPHSRSHFLPKKLLDAIFFHCAFCNLRIAYLFFLSCGNVLFLQACYVLHGPPARLDQIPRKPGRQPRKGGEGGAENSKENEKSSPSSLPACLQEEPPLCAVWRKNAFNVIWGRLQRLIQVCPHCYSSQIGKLIYWLCGRGWY